MLLPAFTVSFRINLIVLLDFPSQNVEQGGVSVDGEIVKDIKAVYTKEVAAFFFKIGKWITSLFGDKAT
mgnify:CR=1 FL=1